MQEQQPGESSQAHAAYCAYRDAGPSRSLRSTAAALGKSASLIARWSSAHGWAARVREYDAALWAAESAAREQRIAEAGADWAARREDERIATWAAATSLRARSEDLLKGLDSAKLGDVALALRIAYELVRQVLGEDTAGDTVQTVVVSYEGVRNG